VKSTVPSLKQSYFLELILKGYIDEKYGRDYLHGKSATLYKLLMDRIMNCLIERDVVEVSGSYPYGYSEMSVYKTNQRLKDKRGEFEKYEMGDASLLDKHLPKNR
jgi:hypothetical protein